MNDSCEWTILKTRKAERNFRAKILFHIFLKFFKLIAWFLVILVGGGFTQQNGEAKQESKAEVSWCCEIPF